MAQYVVKVPDIGEGTTEAEIVSWHVAVGDTIREDDPLVDVMTDKATVEIPAPVTGTVVALNAGVGERRPVGSELVTLEVAGQGNVPAEKIGSAGTKRPLTPTLSPQSGRGSAAPPTTPSPRFGGEREGPAAPGSAQSGAEGQAPPRQGEGQNGTVVPLTSANGRARADMATVAQVAQARRPGDKPLASPAVRKQAWDLGIELRFVPGTGPGGRITHDDLDAYVARGAQPVGLRGLPRLNGVEDVPITGLRRTIAERLQESKRRIPHFSYVEEVDVTALQTLRAQLNAVPEGRPRLTILPFLMRAIVKSVAEHRQVNARYDDDNGILHRFRAVHIGTATQTEGGLMVPVVQHAEALDVFQAAAEVQRLAEAARNGKATRQELTGSTITISSLGRLGGIAATPVINYPEVAIIGVNRVAERPVVRDGQIVVRQMMNLSSSFDHRIVDGWDAASFIQQVKTYLEQPATLLVG